MPLCAASTARRDEEEPTPSGVEVYLQTLKKNAAAELQHMLVGCEGSVKARTTGKEPAIAVADDTNNILHIAEATDNEDWWDHAPTGDWLSVICYCRSAAIKGAGRGPTLQPAEAKVMKQELSQLEQLVYPARPASLTPGALVEADIGNATNAEQQPGTDPDTETVS